MRDLKDLLEPLGDRPMPDRWDAIQHRPVHPMPESHRSRLGAGIAAAAVAILAIGVIVWLSPLGGPHVEATGLGDPTTWPRYVSPDGWNASVPQAWTAKFYSGPPTPSIYGSIISNPSATAVIPESGDLSSVTLPSDGITMTVFQPVSLGKAGSTPPTIVKLPLSWSDLHVQPASGGYEGGLLFEGPRHIFGISVKLGSDASASDIDALKEVLQGITFDDSSDQLPSPSGPPGLPTSDAVVDGRFVSNVELDDGALSVQPAPIDTVPVISKADAEQLLYASPVFKGMNAGVVGFGLVTSQVSQHGVPTYQSDPAWIAFGWGAFTDCPMMTGTLSPTDLPSNGYVAAALIEGAGGGDISYEARSDPCGISVTGPTVQLATHIESVAWTQIGQISGSNVRISYTMPPCGRLASYDAGGSGDSDTLTVEAEVPDIPGSCASPSPLTDVVHLDVGGQAVATIHHAPTGILRQAPF